jgi:hypothetical protein
MKVSAIAAAVALTFGAAAFAQAQDHTSRTENSASADARKPADDADRTKNALHRLGDKTRRALHRAEDKMHAKNDAHHADRDHDRHARLNRKDDTRAMGAPSRDLRDRDLHDRDNDRRSRMDQAYENWKARHHID